MAELFTMLVAPDTGLLYVGARPLSGRLGRLLRNQHDDARTSDGGPPEQPAVGGPEGGGQGVALPQDVLGDAELEEPLEQVPAAEAAADTDLTAEESDDSAPPTPAADGEAVAEDTGAEAVAEGAEAEAFAPPGVAANATAFAAGAAARGFGSQTPAQRRASRLDRREWREIKGPQGYPYTTVGLIESTLGLTRQARCRCAAMCTLTARVVACQQADLRLTLRPA